MRNKFCYILFVKITISKQQVSRFLLQKQLLLPPKLLVEKSGVERVFQTLRLLQFDPLNPCGQNVELVLQAKIADYHSCDYYTWPYQEKQGIEFYNKALCIVPIKDYQLIRHKHHAAENSKPIKLFSKKYQ